MSRILASAGLFGVFLGVLLAAVLERPGPTAIAAPAVASVSVQVSSKLPVWAAPGVRFTLSGFAGARELVRARLSGRSVAVVRSGRLGRFRLVVAAPRPGRYAVSVTTASSTARLGALRVRPVILDAVGDVTTGEDVGATVTTLGSAYPWSRVGATCGRRTSRPRTSRASCRPAVQPLPTRSSTSAARLRCSTAHASRADSTSSQSRTTTRATSAASDCWTRSATPTPPASRRSVEAGTPQPRCGRSSSRPAACGSASSASRTSTRTASTPPPTRPARRKRIRDTVAAAVRAARRQADVVVCWFHWGTELHPDPSARQQELAAAALHAGAQVVLARTRTCRPCQLPDARNRRRVDARQLRLPVAFTGHRADGDPHGRARSHRRARLARPARDDPRFPARARRISRSRLQAGGGTCRQRMLVPELAEERDHRLARALRVVADTGQQ